MLKKPIRITDTAAIADAIAPIRGNAFTWTLNAAKLQSLAEEAEQKLEAVAILKKERVGAVATVTSRGPSAKSYKYGVTGTRAVLKRFAVDWRLVSYERHTVYPQQSGRLTITLPHEHQATLPTDCLHRLGIEFAKAETVQEPKPEVVMVRTPDGREIDFAAVEFLLDADLLAMMRAFYENSPAQEILDAYLEYRRMTQASVPADHQSDAAKRDLAFGNAIGSGQH